MGAVLAIVLVLIALVAGCFTWPKYNVWQQELSGQASLKKAVHTRQIQIEQARGEKEAALLRAEAIKTIGQAAQAYPEYRYQEFLGAFSEALREGNMHQVVYVPTEAMVPLVQSIAVEQKK